MNLTKVYALETRKKKNMEKISRRRILRRFQNRTPVRFLFLRSSIDRKKFYSSSLAASCAATFLLSARSFLIPGFNVHRTERRVTFINDHNYARSSAEDLLYRLERSVFAINSRVTYTGHLRPLMAKFRTGFSIRILKSRSNLWVLIEHQSRPRRQINQRKSFGKIRKFEKQRRF